LKNCWNQNKRVCFFFQVDVWPSGGKKSICWRNAVLAEDGMMTNLKPEEEDQRIIQERRRIERRSKRGGCC
jgi:hypothetical protein